MPNQVITVTGRGFSDVASIKGPRNPSIVSLDANHSGLKAERGSWSDKINANETIEVDNGGNGSASIVVPVTNASVGAGPHEWKVIHTSNPLCVAVAPRTLTQKRQESRVGIRVTATRTGFPAFDTFDQFGKDVAVDGHKVAVSARLDGDNGYRYGFAPLVHEAQQRGMGDRHRDGQVDRLRRGG